MKKYYKLKLFYPHNDKRVMESMTKILDNLHRIPIEELERITEEF